MFLNTIGSCSYNGYEFDSSMKMTVQCEMVQDEAQRTVIYQKQTYTISATVADDPSSDNAMEDIKARLGEQGRLFVVENKGFGADVRVGPGGIPDLKWGPVPKILTWEPIGSNRAAEIVFQVVVCIGLCNDGSPRRRGVIAFNYEVDFSIEKGHTTRTISGYLEIGQSRQGRRAPDCADLYRHLIKPTLPDGFERRQSHRISKDKSRLDFTIQDSEIASKFAYPQGVVTASGEHRVAWSRNNRGATQLRNSISMELEMAAGVSQARAWAIFGQIVKKRIDFAKRGKRPVLLDELVVSEDIWGRASRFSVGYRVLRSCAACLAAHSGIWQPIDTDWRRWKASMSKVFSERGTANLIQNAGEAIIDLCGEGTPVAINDASDTPGEPGPLFATTFTNETPPPEYSYLKYEQTVMPYRERPVQRQAILQSPEDSSSLRGFDMDTKGKFAFGPPGGTSDIIQEGGQSRYGVILKGEAMRAGYPVPRPSLESIGRQAATEVAFVMPQMIVGNWFGVPIYLAKWVGHYVIGNSPAEMKPEANVKEEVDENGKAICKC